MKKRAIELRLRDRVRTPTPFWGVLTWKVTALTLSVAYGEKVMLSLEEECTPAIHATMTFPAEEEIEVVADDETGG